MATRLKNLKVKKVDFVDDGANPDADIKLFKRNDTGTSGKSAAKNDEKGTGVWKRLLGFIGKAAGIDQEEINSAMDEIQKGDSVSFNEKFNEAKNRKIADEIWDICYALQSSLCSILNDEDMDSASSATAMKESLDEFSSVVQDCITKWSDGKESCVVRKNEAVEEADLEVMKSAVARLNEIIEKASAEEAETSIDNENPKGEEKMDIDKSKLTDSERAFLESIEKRCGTVETGAEATAENPAAPATSEVQNPTPPVTKSAAPVQGTSQDQAQVPGNEDIYKGLHPAVKAELEQLKKFRQDAEDKELHDVVKRYAIIGKKEEELVPVLKSLKAAGGTAYNDMLAVLDQTVTAVEKSGAFSEIGKSGNGAYTESPVETKISGIAKSYMEKDSAMNYSMAVAKAWEDNPKLLAEYEEEAGF